LQRDAGQRLWVLLTSVGFGNHQADLRFAQNGLRVLRQPAKVEIEGSKVGVGEVENEGNQGRFVQGAEGGCLFCANE
jgi:hypothetical protein